VVRSLHQDGSNLQEMKNNLEKETLLPLVFMIEVALQLIYALHQLCVNHH
jgi:hypothetical protein